MNRSEVIEKLKAIEPQLRAHGVAALYLFGSYARDEVRPESDLDVFIDPTDEDAFGLMPLFDSRAVLENTLPGMEIAYSTRDSIVPRYRPFIECDAIRVF